MEENKDSPFTVNTGIGKMTDKLINTCIGEFGKKHNKDKINKFIVNPIIDSITEKFYPYVITVSILYVMILVLIFIIIFLVQRKK